MKSTFSKPSLSIAHVVFTRQGRNDYSAHSVLTSVNSFLKAKLYLLSQELRKTADELRDQHLALHKNLADAEQKHIQLLHSQVATQRTQDAMAQVGMNHGANRVHSAE